MGLNIFPESSGGAVWGDITGTLSDQTDLQSALDAKLASASVLRSYLAATVTYNNVDVLANTALSVTVAAGGIYAIELVIHTDAGGMEHLLTDFGGTATFTNFIGQYYFHAEADGAVTGAQRVTAAGTDADVGIDSENGIITFTGSAEVNAGGTFIVRGAQHTATAVNTTILRGSTLTLTKMN